MIKNILLTLFCVALLAGCAQVLNEPLPATPPDNESFPSDSTYDDAVGLYVSTAGSDTAGDGTIGNPYRTVQHAVNLAPAGSIIVLRTGTYNESVDIRTPLTIRSKNDEWAVIQTPTTDDTITETIRFNIDTGWTSGGAKLYRLELVGGYYYAVKFETMWDWGGADRSGVSNVTIEACKIHDTGRDCVKITPNCDDIRVVNCEIYNSGVRDNSNAEAIDNVNGDRAIVADCVIHDIATNGLYFKGGATDCVAERNYIYNCGGGGIGLGYDTSPEFFDLTANPEYFENINGIVRNNVIYNTQYFGIGMYAAKNPRVLNNTIVNAAQTAHSPIYFGISFQDWDAAAGRPACEGAIIKNNIAVSASPDSYGVFIRYTGDLGGLNAYSGMPAMDHNRYYKPGGGSLVFVDQRPAGSFNGDLAGWKSHLSWETNSTEGDPTLDSTYHLNSGSPCVDAGETLSQVVYDIDKQTRSGLYDIGADER
ncbi:MAG: right-handed parallel beta-helix repeat-containing protein [Candidatus Margulisiibacteriota bacterium]